jgi:hypothetical protein
LPLLLRGIFATALLVCDGRAQTLLARSAAAAGSAAPRPYPDSGTATRDAAVAQRRAACA